MKKFFGVILRAIVFYEYVILHFALKELKKKVDEGNHNSYRGICGNLAIPRHIKSSLRSLFSRWPKYTGNPIYPVPSLYKDTTSKWAYNSIALWHGEYGKLRIELLDHMIEDSKNIILIGFNWKNGEK